MPTNDLLKPKNAAYQPVEKYPDAFSKKRTVAAVSPDQRYQVLAGTYYRNLLLYDTQEKKVLLIRRDRPNSKNQHVHFTDRHTFCVEDEDIVDFYNALTGEHVDFLEMQFGKKEGQKTLLGFTYDSRGNRFASLYVNEEPRKVLFHKYWAALFDRAGKLLDSFRTDIPLLQNWGKIVVPELSMEGEQLVVSSSKFVSDYVLTFYTHKTERRAKNLYTKRTSWEHKEL